MILRYALIGLVALGLLTIPLAGQEMENVPPARQTAAPPSATTLKVAVLDLQAAVWRTQEGQEAQEEMQAQFAPHSAELQKLVQEIQEIENRLRTQERTLSNEARTQLVRDLDRKRRTGQRLQEDLQTDSQIAQNDHAGTILEKMQKVIDQYAREKGYAIVINSSANPNPVIYRAPAVEITDDVIRLYDQLYPVATKPAEATGQAKPPAKPSSPQPPRSPR
ncbi:MAG: OmpH family outer membrane protein [Terriglobia bacterium]